MATTYTYTDNDTTHAVVTATGDSIFANGDNDVITATGGNGVYFNAEGAPNGGENFTGTAAGNDTIFASKGDDTINVGTGTDTVYGLAGDDSIFVGNSAAATVFGGMGNDTLDATGSTGQHFLSGDAGNDTIFTGTGGDTAYGGNGDDSIFSGGGNDALYGQQGNDTIDVATTVGNTSTVFGGQGDDLVTASGAGGHYISGDLGNDVITATTSTGADSIFGGMGNDTIDSGTAAQTVYGGQGDDVITSHDTAAHQVLSGDLGNDSITAGAGGDTLVGGVGADTLVGGGGADTFYEHLGDSTSFASNSTTTTTTTSGATTTTTSTTTQVASDANLDHIVGFASGTDHVVFGGHNALIVTAGVGSPTNVSVDGTIEADYNSAYAYAYGGTTTPAAGTTVTYSSHFTTGIEYVEVHTAAGVGTPAETYVFTADHQAVALDGVTANLANGDVLGTAS